eukprot:scaffold21031_cov25-Tisochrysis_lutea.AAC.1
MAVGAVEGVMMGGMLLFDFGPRGGAAPGAAPVAVGAGAAPSGAAGRPTVCVRTAVAWCC